MDVDTQNKEIPDRPSGSLSTPSSKWWIGISLTFLRWPITVLYSVIAGAILLGWELTFLEPVFGIFMIALLAVWFVLPPLGVHYDRIYLARTADFTPSRISYFVFIPLLGEYICSIYLWNRRKALADSG